MWTRMAFVMLLVLVVASWGMSFIHIGDLKVSLYSGGWLEFNPADRPQKQFKEWSFSNIYDLNIKTGQEYYIRIENVSSRPIGVYVFVDGLNVIGREADGGSWWYLEPNQTFDLGGWQLDNEFRSNFEFVDLGAPSGQGGKYPGWIFIAQYRVKVPKPVPPPRYGYDKNVTMETEGAEVQAAGEMRAEASKSAAPTGAETGTGTVQHHNVEEVDYNIETYPTGLAAIFYSKEKPQVVAPPPCNAWLGLDALSNVDDGVYISYIYPNSPAAMAGLERGDVIRSFNGIRVRYRAELHELVAKCKGGEKVVVEVQNVRDKRIYDVTAFIGCR